MELFGRERELLEVTQRVSGGRRLVTIVGPGGIGKTSLARAVLARLESSFPGGARVADLSRIDRGEAVAGALAAQLGFSSFEALVQSPSELPALLLIDNCEHVITAAGVVIDALLEASPASTVLATSRSPLGVVDESIVALGPLDVPALAAPAESSSAVRMFVERARHAGVDIGAEELVGAGALCRALDGLPLAIELAAARTRTLTVGDILARLASGIEVLASPRADVIGRHRSLGETIEWSLSLLDDDARCAFERLGVCAGPFSLDVAAAVMVTPTVGATVTLDVVERLVDASLIVAERTSRGARYRLLEPIRAVALSHLEVAGELEATRDRLAGLVVELVTETLAVSRVRWDADLLPTLLELFDSIDAAVRHYLRTDPSSDRALLLYATLWGVVHQSRVDEVVELGLLVRERWPALDVPFAADAAATLGIAQLLCGRTEEGVALAELADAHAHLGFFGPVTAQRVLGLAARIDGDHERAARHMTTAAEAATQAHVPTMNMECRVYGAQDVAWSGHPGAALTTVRQVAAEARAAASVLNEIWARTVEGAILQTTDPAAARPVIEATLDAAEAIEYPFGITCNLQTLARWHLANGSLPDAAEVVGRLIDTMGRAGAGDLRVALELSAAVTRAAGRAGWNDLVATAQTMPNTNPMVGGDQRTNPATSLSGRVLQRPAAVRTARQAMSDIVDAGTDISSAAAPADDGAVFVRIGDAWDVRFAGTSITVKTSKGMADIAALLARPGRDVHCLELAGVGVEQSSTGVVMDDTARRQYVQRVRELQADIDEAEADHDIGRVDGLRVELNLLVDHLSAAFGLGGRSRRGASSADRARSAVTHRVRSTIRHLGTIHPPLGRHLQASVTTGLYCSYRPETPTTWRT